MGDVWKAREKEEACACPPDDEGEEEDNRGEYRGWRLVLVELAGRDWHENEVKKRKRGEEWYGVERKEGRNERERKVEEDDTKAGRERKEKGGTGRNGAHEKR